MRISYGLGGMRHTGLRQVVCHPVIPPAIARKVGKIAPRRKQQPCRRQCLYLLRGAGRSREKLRARVGVWAGSGVGVANGVRLRLMIRGRGRGRGKGRSRGRGWN